MAKKKKAIDKKEPSSPSKLLSDYVDILDSTVQKIKSAQGRAMSAVNKELIEVYRDIGKTIYDQQEGGTWGDAIVKTFASDLQKKFPGMKGFSYRNLYTMRDFYTSFRDSEKLQTLSAQISWSHNVAILSKCKDPLEKEFYPKDARKLSPSGLR